MNTKDKYWLAGLLEGEGCFMAGPPSKPNLPLVVLQMTDKDVIEKAANLFGVTMCRHRQDTDWKESWTTRIRGKKAVDLMKEIQPLMGERRKQQIQKALESYNPQSKKLTEKELSQIRTELKGSKTQSQIAKKFGIRRETVNRIKRRSE